MSVTDNNNNFNTPEDDQLWELGESGGFDPASDAGTGEAPTPQDGFAEERAASKPEEPAGRGRRAGAKEKKKDKKPKPEKKAKAKKPDARAEKKRKKDKAEDALPAMDDALPEMTDDRPEAKKRRGSKKAKKEAQADSGRKSAGALHRIKLTLIILLVFVALLAAFSAAGGFYVTHNGVTLPNVYIGGVFVGNMSREQVDKALKDSGWDKRTAEELTVKLPAGTEFTVSYEKSGARMTREEAVQAACGYGHDRDWFSNLYLFLLNHLNPANADPEIALDGEYIKAQVAVGEEKLEKATEDKGYEIDKEKERLIIVKGAGQIKIAQDALREEIEKALLNDETEIRFETLASELAMPDFQKLHDTLAVEPEDAYFTENFEVVDEIDGCWFEVSEAEKLWQEAKPTEKVEIPMTLTYPEVTGEALRSMLYRDKLGAQTTYYTWSNDNRISNINKVAEKINGHIMMPGDVFSYNDFVGQRTEEAGFLPAGAYENGQVVEEVGGGICQASSTLYCAAMYAQMDTVERTSHYFRVDYLPLAQDATVSWPKPDFKFRNSREYPVKIVAFCDNEEKSLTIEIWGTDVDGSYVQLRHETYTRYDGTYTDVAIGYYVLGFRQIFDAEGNFLYEIEEPASDYFFHEEDINWPDEKYASEDG